MRGSAKSERSRITPGTLDTCEDRSDTPGRSQAPDRRAARAGVRTSNIPGARKAPDKPNSPRPRNLRSRILGVRVGRLGPGLRPRKPAGPSCALLDRPNSAARIPGKQRPVHALAVSADVAAPVRPGGWLRFLKSATLLPDKGAGDKLWSPEVTFGEVGRKVELP
jgi:hypothetical protein